MKLTIPCRRLISRGDLPGSDGGIYNPGATLTRDGIVLVPRREIDLRFSTIAHAERVVLDPDTLALVSHRTLARRGYPEDVRLEDFRTIEHRGQSLAVHTVVRPGSIRPMISRLGERTIEPADPVALPFATPWIEKNWALFEHEGRLHMLYRLDPLTILARDDAGAWRLVKRVHNGWGDRFRKMLSNSANLVPFDGGLLGFWHSIVGERYVQGALKLDRNLDLVAATGVLLDGKRVRRGVKPGVLYVSALVVRGGEVLAFHGEADEHVGVATIDAGWLAEQLRAAPFVPVQGLRVQLAPGSMGELFRAMDACRRIVQRRDRPHVWIEAATPEVAQIVPRFGIPRLSVRDFSEPVDVSSPMARAAD